MNFDRVIGIISEDDELKRLCDIVNEGIKKKELRKEFLKRQFENAIKEEDKYLIDNFEEIFSYLKRIGKIDQSYRFKEWGILFNYEKDFVAITKQTDPNIEMVVATN